MQVVVAVKQAGQVVVRTETVEAVDILRQIDSRMPGYTLVIGDLIIHIVVPLDQIGRTGASVAVAGIY